MLKVLSAHEQGPDHKKREMSASDSWNRKKCEESITELKNVSEVNSKFL